jgi:hypothetical protein
LFAPCHPNIGLVAATVRAAAEVFRNVRLLAIERLSFVSIVERSRSLHLSDRLRNDMVSDATGYETAGVNVYLIRA